MTELFSRFVFQLKLLSLLGSSIGDGGFIAISSCMSKIEELVIGTQFDDNLTMKGITALANAVANSPTKVRVIILILQKVAISYLNAFLDMFFALASK